MIALVVIVAFVRATTMLKYAVLNIDAGTWASLPAAARLCIIGFALLTCVLWPLAMLQYRSRVLAGAAPASTRGRKAHPDAIARAWTAATASSSTPFFAALVCSIIPGALGLLGMISLLVLMLALFPTPARWERLVATAEGAGAGASA